MWRVIKTPHNKLKTNNLLFFYAFPSLFEIGGEREIEIFKIQKHILCCLCRKNKLQHGAIPCIVLNSQTCYLVNNLLGFYPQKKFFFLNFPLSRAQTLAAALSGLVSASFSLACSCVQINKWFFMSTWLKEKDEGEEKTTKC